MDSGGFHVFHDGSHHGVLAVADAVHVEFGCVFEEAVDEDGLAFTNGGGFFYELAEVLFLIDNHHAAATENEAGAHQNGVADFLDDGEGIFHVVGDAFSFGRSRTCMCGRAILQGLPCAPTARPRRSCNGATAPPQGVTLRKLAIPNADATS